MSRNIEVLDRVHAEHNIVMTALIQHAVADVGLNLRYRFPMKPGCHYFETVISIHYVYLCHYCCFA
jgi:hypothetical protein